MATVVVTRDEPRTGRRPGALSHAGALLGRLGTGSTTSLRVGVERGMVAMVAVSGPLLVLQCLPEFLAQRSMGSALTWMSLLLAIAPCVLVPLALRGGGTPDRTWLLLSVACFLLLVPFERFEIRVPVPTGFEPWLAGIACITASYVAIGIDRPPFAGAVCVAIVTEVGAVYGGTMDTALLVVDLVGVLALSTALIIGVRILRARADRGDASRRAAQKQFERSRRHLALEEERNRTDALLHDSVLTTFLVAAGEQDSPGRSVLMARRALEVVSAIRRAPAEAGTTESFERAVLAAERDFAAIRGRVRLDLSAARAVELPLRTSDALIAALVQALTNSVKHAGPGASCVARAEPTVDGGLRIIVHDDGCGFDVAAVEPERLGLRVSITERVRAVGGVADIRSSPGVGTTIVLEWSPDCDDVAAELPEAALT